MRKIETWELKKLALVTGEPVLAQILEMSEKRLGKLFKDELVSEREYQEIIKRTEIPEKALVKKEYDWSREPRISFREENAQDKEKAMLVANNIINYWENLSRE